MKRRMEGGLWSESGLRTQVGHPTRREQRGRPFPDLWSRLAGTQSCPWPRKGPLSGSGMGPGAKRVGGCSGGAQAKGLHPSSVPQRGHPEGLYSGVQRSPEGSRNRGPGEPLDSCLWFPCSGSTQGPGAQVPRTQRRCLRTPKHPRGPCICGPEVHRSRGSQGPRVPAPQDLPGPP